MYLLADIFIQANDTVAFFVGYFFSLDACELEAAARAGMQVCVPLGGVGL